MGEGAEHEIHGVFGAPPRELVVVPRQAVQFSPLFPGARPLAAADEAALAGMIMLAPAGTIERRRALALALRALRPGAELIALAPKDKGGARIAKELTEMGCAPQEKVKSHHRIVSAIRPQALPDLTPVLAEGAMRFVEETGFWSQPGIFGWDKIDPGSALLAANLPALKGRGADLGCGYGLLARIVLQSPAVTSLALIDIDGRAVEAARHNVQDPRAVFHWADIRRPEPALERLDFVVMNAPFHDGGQEDRSLCEAFLRRAASALRPGGTCWLVANRHLPYEALIVKHFKAMRPVTEERGFKVYEAER